MESRKRPRVLRDEDEDEIELSVESASSSLQQSHKRPRTVLAAENSGSVVSDEDDEEDDSDTEDNGRRSSIRPSMVPESEYDATQDEAIGTQYMAKQFHRLGQNTAMESGIIEEIYCRNFMCHTKLRVKLGPLINFIIGHNGSGKSAVLTALTVCLGGKAATTNRGANLKGMIKQGEDSATLSVKIKNQGDGAFRPEIFGRSIIVERNISRSNAATFKIKSADDKVVSTKKKDLAEIIDYFALQLDNPINVLNQDMARQFLSNSTPSDKYKFFIRGTRLESLDADYKLLEEHLDGVETKLADRVDDIALLKSKADEAEAKKRRSDAAGALHLEVQKTKRMHAWAQVIEQEQFLEQRERDIARAEKDLEQSKEEADQASADFDVHKQANEQAMEVVRQLREEALPPVQAAFDAQKEKFDNGRSSLTNLIGDERSAKTEFKSHKERRIKLEKQIEDEQRLLDAAAGDGHGQRLEELARLKDAVRQAKTNREEHAEALRPLQENRSARDRALAEIERPLSEHRDEVTKAEHQLEKLSAQQNHRFNGYNRNMPRLVSAIEQERRWRSKPVGPMGQYMRIKKPEWTGLIEKTFGGVLEAFVVTTQEDRALLLSTMNRVGCKVTVYLGDSTPIDTTGHEPDPAVDTVLRILDFTSDLVRNQVIINQAVEQLVLIPDRATASRWIYADPRPPFVRAAMCFTDDRSGAGHRFEFMRSGGQKVSPIQRWVGAPRLQVDRREQTRIAEEDLRRAKLQLDATERSRRELQQAVKSAEQEIVRHKRRANELIINEQSENDTLDALQEEIEKNRPQDGKLQELQRQLTDAQEEESAHRRIVEELVHSRATLDEKQREVKRSMDDATTALKNANEDVENKAAEQRQLDNVYHTYLRQKNAALEAVNDRKEYLQGCVEARDKQKQVLQEDFTIPAESICARIPVEEGVTPTILDARLARFAEDIQRAEEEMGGSPAELAEAWKDAVVSHHTAKKEYDAMKKLSQQLKQSLEQRHKRWTMFRRFIGLRAKISFTYFLSERDFRGNILLDHYAKVLDPKVEPNMAVESNAGREARTLSGGEKSFSTICLLLSIWEAIASPIRCLDEFDVFMDSVNRATSMSMMIKAARRSVGRQFILITPQSMQNVELGDDVSIHRMSDPERGQTVLPYEPV